MPDPEPPPEIPEYSLLRPIGEGSYGSVWLARTVTGVFRAVKIVRRDSFSHDRPYDREFIGIQKFEPFSRSQPNLLNIFHAGRNDAEGFFYYVMEIGDCQQHGAEIDPDDYHPRALNTDLRRTKHLSCEDCLTMGAAIAGALDHMHRNGLVHRDVKPANIIYANGVPKLADIGLVASRDASRSFVGTEGFVPPDGPGTPRADAYGLGKVLYQCATGKDHSHFPMLPAEWKSSPEHGRLLELNEIILKACEPDPRRAYRGAGDMLEEIQILQSGRSLKKRRAMERRLHLLSRIGAVAGVVSLLTGAGWWLAQSRLQSTTAVLTETTTALAVSRAETLSARMEAGYPDLQQATLTAIRNAAATGGDPLILRTLTASALATGPVTAPETGVFLTFPGSPTLTASPASLSLSADGRWIVTTTPDAVAFTDIHTPGQPPLRVPVPGVQTAAIEPGSGDLLTTSPAGTVRRRLLAAGDGSDTLQPPAAAAESTPPPADPLTAECAAGPLRASVTGPRTISLTTGGTPVLTLTSPDRLTVIRLAFAPDGRSLAALHADGSLAVWHLARLHVALSGLALDPGFPAPPAPAFDESTAGRLSVSGAGS